MAALKPPCFFTFLDHSIHNVFLTTQRERTNNLAQVQPGCTRSGPVFEQLLRCHPEVCDAACADCSALLVRSTLPVCPTSFGSYGGSSGGGHTGGGSVSSSSGRSYSTSGVSPTHRGSGIGTNAHSGGEFVSERSHARIAALPAEILAGAAHSSALQAARQELTALPEAKSDLSSVVREPWMQEQIRLHTVSGNAAKDFRQGKFDSELRDYGLEPSKKAYSARLAALGQSPERAALAKKPGWFAKTFMGKSADPERGKPCKGKQCNPPPKPCHGKTCKPSPTPTTAPSAYCWGFSTGAIVMETAISVLREPITPIAESSTSS